jgi:hypothetical protein
VEDNYSQVWEIHTFTQSGTLAFSAGGSVIADYLIVAGGGGSGGVRSGDSPDASGGGGAGGLLYAPGVTLETTNPVAVTVGTGGNGGAANYRGTNGTASGIGAVSVPGGGGGGAGNATTDPNGVIKGSAGGSGGGGGAGGSTTTAVGGSAVNSTTSAVVGYAGGKSGASNGGGGGGAGGPGHNPTDAYEDGEKDDGAGGASWNAASEAPWVATATGTTEFSRGGRGGNSTADGTGDNYGDGGPGTGVKNTAGAKGHDGIVVIRFQRPN